MKFLHKIEMVLGIYFSSLKLHRGFKIEILDSLMTFGNLNYGIRCFFKLSEKVLVFIHFTNFSLTTALILIFLRHKLIQAFLKGRRNSNIFGFFSFTSPISHKICRIIFMLFLHTPINSDIYYLGRDHLIDNGNS
jgi:hypothetical protein